MNQKTIPAVPVWYWVIAAAALLWNLLGCVAFGTEIFAQEAMMDSMTEDQLVMPTLVIVFSAALLWFSWFARSRSWFGQVHPTE